MNQDDIFMKCKCAGSPEVLALMNDKTKLREMYAVLYQGLMPRPSSTKVDIAYSLWQFYQDDIRTKDLCKIL